MPVNLDDLERISTAYRVPAPAPRAARREARRRAHVHLAAGLGWRHHTARAAHAALLPLMILSIVFAVAVPTGATLGAILGSVEPDLAVVISWSALVACAVLIVAHARTQRWRQFRNATRVAVIHDVPDEVVVSWLRLHRRDSETAQQVLGDLLALAPEPTIAGLDNEFLPDQGPAPADPAELDAAVAASA